MHLKNNKNKPNHSQHCPSTLSILDSLHRPQDYYEIIKNPMDLQTIGDKLKNNAYKEPWQFVDDVGLMFDNAWLYNKKTSKVYKCCSKVWNGLGIVVALVFKGMDERMNE